MPARDALFETMSGDPVKPLYTAADLPEDVESALGRPGEFPYTRGVYESMYRGRVWTMRQFAGFGDRRGRPTSRFHYLLGARPDRPLDGVRHAVPDGP